MSGCYLAVAVSAHYGPFHHPHTGARYTPLEMVILFHVLGGPRFAARYEPDAFYWAGVFGLA